jgi:hypothetical protein
VAETVRFCCPHCQQEYFGQAPLGHPVPRAFSCVGCGAEIDLDEMVVLPAEGMTEADTRPGVVPWLERRKRGTVKAFLATVGLAMVRPGTLMRGVPRDAPVGEALAFGIVTLTLAIVVGGSLPTLGYWVWTSIIMGGWATRFWEVFQFGFLGLVTLFLVAGAIPVLALVSHGVLRLGGRPQHALDRTIQAVGYSAGAGAVSAIPCVGPFVGWVWWLVSAMIMVRAGQQVSGGRATAAVLVLPVTLMVIIGGLAALVAWWASSAFGGTILAGPGFNPQSQQTYVLSDSLRQYSWQNNQTGPEHGIELAIIGYLGAWPWSSVGGTPFCQAGTKTTPKDIPVGDATFEDFVALSTSERLGVVKTVLEAVPDGIIAHRVGDFVFTHHGATVSGNDPGLWLVVMVPDPGANGIPAPQDAVYIGTDSYTLTEITFGELAQALTEQNAYRKTLGLPPLPDLTTVTHERPALAPAASGPRKSQDNP